MTERQNEIDRLGARLDPEVRSWIKSVIVPILVRQSIDEFAGTNRVAEHSGAMPQSQPNGVPSAEGIL